ncbi:hypothetical protein [Rhizobium sp. BK376]|uniref:hypothetical protein n=1 Tax=Rhizobium sp. BK376 TaxID=2512149 RepID=UPI0010431759|nr:hypothetical protein [Rhizobium sp. BK376]TCR82100.1 hypothetical protein EV561_1111 [Rhizobium sp. BK376]
MTGNGPMHHTSGMSKSWDDIIVKLREKQGLEGREFQTALSGVAQVASLIAEGPLNSVLFGWTSMHDLCVQQTDTTPYSGPYLRISPLPSGSVEFRYVDTGIAKRQWTRVESAGRAARRFTAFVEQLRWDVSGL